MARHVVLVTEAVGGGEDPELVDESAAALNVIFLEIDHGISG